ncbi:uncharacterized protein LOC117102668 [Anneissia japonica]|uniref:uncharacterized protein LOC117102668 n=1 Tax=Anneissia japonica TaxID=1529436 RepID=UPI001425A0AD|nr:uncharacterized protein LOC117102668 [Anneissia japonica]
MVTQSVITVGLVVSVTVNLLAFLYFAIYDVIENVLNRWGKKSTELVTFHKGHAAKLRITYLDTFVGLALPTLAVAVTFTSGVLTNRLKTAEVQIQAAFSVALGVFIFMLVMNILVKSPNRSVDIVYDVVAITAFVVALYVKEEPFIGLIVMTSQGSRSTNQVQFLMKNYWNNETPCCRKYGVVVVMNTIFTVFFNGVIPLMYLLSTIMQTYSMKSQLSSFSIGCFYAYLIFFSFMNGWALCAVTDESKKFVKRNKNQPSYQTTVRPPGTPLRIIANSQTHGDRSVHAFALPNEILPPSYAQAVKEKQPILAATCEKDHSGAIETDFVAIPLQSP